MSDRWAFDDSAKLRERVAIIETQLGAMRFDMDRQFRQLSEGQASNRAYTETELTSIKTLLRASQPQALNDDVTRMILGVGGIVTLLLILFVIYWVSTTWH